MPDTSYTGIQVPDATDPYSFETILGALADSARVIVPAASPTAMAQVADAATAAGFGATAAAPLYVHRTDQDAVYINEGAGWVRVTGKAGAVPFVMAAGEVSYDMAGTNLKEYAVTFPSGRFSVTPVILVSTTHFLIATAGGSSASGTTVTLRTPDGSTSTNAGTARYVALQMTPTSAGG